MAVLGTVVAINGTTNAVNEVTVVTESGIKKQLHLNDTIQSGDTIITPPGVIVELQLVNGKVLPIFAEQTVKFTPEFADAVPASSGDSAVDQATIQAVIKAINEGRDIGDVLEETAAGIDGGSTTSYGFGFENLLRIVEAVNPLAFQFDSRRSETLTIEPEFAEPDQSAAGSTPSPGTADVVVDIVDTNLNVADTSSVVTFTFSEAPVGFVLGDITATNGTVTNLLPTGNPLIFTATFTANPGFAGSGSVSVPPGTYTNGAGTPGTGGNDTVGIDTAPPVPTITLNANITADDIINLAESGQNIPVTGTVGGDAQVGDTVTLTVNGNTYTGLVQPGLTFSILVPGADLVADPDGTIDASVTTTDAAGNSGSATDTEGYSVNTGAPSVVVDIADTNLNVADTSSVVTFTFSEAPVGFVLGDITATNGTVTNLLPTGNPLIFTATFTANPGFAGSGSVSVAPGTYTNGAGTPGTGGNDTVGIDTAPPVPTITLNANITADDIINLAESGQNIPVTGTVGGDAQVGDTVTLTVNGNTYTGLVQPGLTFSILVPGADLVADPDGTIDASVTTTDAAGNSGSATDTEGYSVNTGAPSVVVDIADTNLNVADTSSVVTFTFSEAPVGFVLGDITATNGTVTNLLPTGNPLIFTATFTANPGFAGSGSVSVPPGTYTNGAGTPGTGGNDTVGIDTAPPVPTITLNANITADDIINLAESGQNIPVTGTVGGDAQVGDTVTLTVNGNTYTGLVQPGLTFSILVPGADLVADPDGTIDASVTTTDAAGNSGSATDTEGYSVEISAPVIAAQSFNYAENQTAGATVATVTATDNVAVTGYRFAATGTNTSADGFYSISNAGVITITAAGVASGANDFETAPNSRVYSVTALDAAGNNSSANITLNETDLDDNAPVIAAQSFNYAENQVAGATVATVTATDNVAVTGYRFAATGTNTSADGFYSISNAGVITITAAGVASGANDFETAPNSRVYSVTALDAAGNNSSANITLNETDLDDNAPVIAAQSFNYAENQVAGATVATVTATDNVAVTGYRFAATGTNTSADGFYSISNAGVITITAAGVASGANDFETAPNSRVYSVTALDAAGNNSSANITLNETDLDDNAPVIAAQSFNYAENQVAGATVATVTATDNVAVTGYRFAATGTNTSADGFYSISNAGVITITAAGVASGANDFETAPNSRVYSVTALDAAGNNSSANITLNETDLDDNAPVIAAQSFNYAENQVAGATVATVTATDNVAVTGYRFAATGTNTSADGFYSISNAGVITITAAGVASGANDFETAPNSRVYSVTALDAAGNNSSANITLNETDLDDNAPVIAAQSFNYAENQVAGATVATVTATDNVAVTGYRFAATGTNTSADGFYSISNAGVITITAAGVASGANDFETAPNSRVYSVTALDAAGNNSSANITLNETDLDDNAPVIAAQSFNYAENQVAGATVATVTATDNVAVTGYRFAATGTNTSADGFYSISNAGVITITAAGVASGANDFETAPNSRVYSVTALDAAGNGSSANITLNETDLDDNAPVIAAQSFNYAENQVAGATVATVTATDNVAVTGYRFAATGTNTSADGFYSISNAGVITITAAGVASGANDFETAPNSRVYSVTALDAAGNNSSANITLNETDLDDNAPVIAAQSFNYAENQVAGATVATVTATDNVAVTGYRFAATGTNTSADGFYSISNAGVITITAAGVASGANDFETAPNSRVYSVTALDAAGNNSSANITLNETDLDDNAPVIAAQSFNYAENQVAGATVATVTATDNVAVTGYRFAATGTNTSADGFYSISNAGVITITAAGVASGANDFETAPNSRVYSVTALDAAGNNSSANITLNETDLDDNAPVIAAQSFNYAENQVAGATVATVTATDNVAVTGYRFAATGTNTSADGFYSISNAGVITITAAGVASGANDFETAPNSRVYSVTALDAAGNNSSANITLNETDLDDNAPVIAAQSFNYAENQVAGATVATVTATDNVAVTGYRFAATGTNTSADGFYSISNAGVITITAAGVASGANDFETAPNSRVYSVTALDAAGNNSSANITLNETDLDDNAPVIAAQSFNYAENQVAGATVATVTATDNVAVTGYRFAATGTNTSADGFYSISNAGVITITAAGVASGANDFETAPNSRVYSVTALDAAGNNSSANITLNETDLDDNAPVIAAQSFNYAENQVAGATVATVTATDNVAVTGYRFAATGTNTSADGFYSISNAGVITITAAGVASGANDFETAPNSRVYSVTALDAAGNNSSANITLNETDLDDNAPVIAAQSFNYAENQVAGATVATVTATDNVAVTGYRFAATGTNTSADGFYSISNAGVITITAAGVASGANDFETAPNSRVYSVTALDAAGNNSSANITLNETDLDDNAPVIAAQSFNYAENQVAGATVATVTATDNVAVTGYRFAATGTNTSADGFYSISNAGVITITAAGVASGANDFETAPNSRVYSVTALDAAGNNSSANITLNETDLDDNAPVIAAQSFNYAENQVAGATVATVTATDNVAVTGYRFAATGTNTSADGFYSISNAGVITITAAGVASGANDFETAPNSRVYSVTALDAAGNNSSANITLNETDATEPPVLDLDLSGAGTGYTASYTENAVGTPIADTDVTITDVDSTNITSATITLTNAQTGDILSVLGALPGGIVASAYNAGTGVITLSGSATLAQYQAAIRLIGFSNTTENPSTIARTINVFVNDGTANSNTAVTTVNVTATNDAPIVGTASASVSEEGLTGGNLDAVGTPDTTNATIASGTIAVSDAESAITVTLTAPVAALTSGGVTVTWTGGGTQTLIGSVGAVEVIRATINNAGNYTVTLSKAIDHATAGSEDVRTIAFGVSATDGTLTTAGTLNVSVEDDSPVANTSTTTVGGTASNTNLSLILDLSGSMNTITTNNTTRLQAAKAAVKELIDGYDSLGNVMVNLSVFGTTGNAVATSGTWMTAANAIIFLDTLTAPNTAQTNYDAALAVAMSSFAATGKIAGGQNVLYFLSDGAPTESDGNVGALTNASGGANADDGIQGAEETIWTNFLTTNQINAFAFGMGIDAATTANMDPIAYNGVTATNTNAVPVTDLSTLSSTLANTIVNTTSGQITTGGSGTGSFGADGGDISQLTYGTNTFTYNSVANTVTRTGAGTTAFTYTAGTRTLVLTTAAGTFSISMDTGAYTFTTTAANIVPQEVFSYTLLDADGDTASGSLTINLNTYNAAPVVRDESVFVQNTALTGTSVTIKDSWLLWNDSDREGTALTISAVNNATSHVGLQVVDTVASTNSVAGANVMAFNATPTGNFNYNATDGNDTNNAITSIFTTTNNTLNGNALDNILIGGTGNNTLNGNEGSDVLVGGAGNDTLNGGIGRDLLIGGTGNDNLTGGVAGDTVSDTFKWELADQGTLLAPAQDTIANFSNLAASAGGDVLDLRDLLTGEAANATSLDNYLHFQFNGGNTTIYVSATGAFSDNNNVGAPPANVANSDVQQIVLTGVNLVGAFTTDQQVITNLLAQQKLITD